MKLSFSTHGLGFPQLFVEVIGLVCDFQGQERRAGIEVAPGFQQAAANKFEDIVMGKSESVL